MQLEKKKIKLISLSLSLTHLEKKMNPFLTKKLKQNKTYHSRKKLKAIKVLIALWRWMNQLGEFEIDLRSQILFE